MAYKNALAGIAVRNIQMSADWYEELLGRPPDSHPMPEIVEWKFGSGGWLQVYEDTERAGSSSCTLAVSELNRHLAELSCKLIEVAEFHSSLKVKTAVIHDPDGNRIILAEALDLTIAQ